MEAENNSSSTLTCAQGQFELRRWPLEHNDQLKAWDAADEYLLRHVEQFADKAPRLLIINDGHGALSTVMHEWQPLSWSDSFLSHQSARANRTLNDIDQPLQVLSSVEPPNGSFDLVLIKVPKTTALLEDQLSKLRTHVHKDTKVIAAGMVKHMQKSAFTCLERTIGPITTSLAVKKARLIFAEVDPELSPADSVFPTSYEDPDIDFTLSNHANVFSRDRLDHGARFFLSQFNKLPQAQQAVDLACGNGVLGIRLQQLQPDALITFIDESYGAVDSARYNHAMAFKRQAPLERTSPSASPMQAVASHEQSMAQSADFLVADGLQLRDSNSTDLILCNPPFHQQHVVGERVATRMFQDCKRCLRKSGQLWIVANRHLDYAKELKRYFGNCQQVAGNKKFVILRVVKR